MRLILQRGLHSANEIVVSSNQVLNCVLMATAAGQMHGIVAMNNLLLTVARRKRREQRSSPLF